VNDGPPGLRSWWAVAMATVRPLFHLGFRMRYEGLDHLPPEGPAIVAPSHVSALDAIPLGMAVYRRGRVMRWVAAAEFFEKPVLGWVLRTFRQIPLRRGARDLGALEDAVRALREDGSLVAIYPEGRVHSERERLRGKSGVARIALAAGVPVIPVGIWGPQVRWPRGRIRFRRPGRPVCAVVVGPPRTYRGDPRSPRDAARVTRDVMAGIREALDRAMEITGPQPAG
jgi:1-acyl-sn-glycerol-3-phosphate acyltransferase